MEFCQSRNVGNLGYCGNDIFLIRWNLYVNIDPKVIAGHIKNIQKKYLEFFWKTWKNYGNIILPALSGNSKNVVWLMGKNVEAW